MNWYEFCKKNYDDGIATANSLKVYTQKGKITVEQYKEITGIDYTE